MDTSEMWHWQTTTWGGFVHSIVSVGRPEEEVGTVHDYEWSGPGEGERRIVEVISAARHRRAVFLVPFPTSQSGEVETLRKSFVDRGVDAVVVQGGRDEFRRFFQEKKKDLDILLVSAIEYLCPWV